MMVLPAKEHAEFRAAIKLALKLQIKQGICNGFES